MSPTNSIRLSSFALTDITPIEIFGSDDEPWSGFTVPQIKPELRSGPISTKPDAIQQATRDDPIYISSDSEPDDSPDTTALLDATIADTGTKVVPAPTTQVESTLSCHRIKEPTVHPAPLQPMTNMASQDQEPNSYAMEDRPEQDALPDADMDVDEQPQIKDSSPGESSTLGDIVPQLGDLALATTGTPKEHVELPASDLPTAVSVAEQPAAATSAPSPPKSKGKTPPNVNIKGSLYGGANGFFKNAFRGSRNASSLFHVGIHG